MIVALREISLDGILFDKDRAKLHVVVNERVQLEYCKASVSLPINYTRLHEKKPGIANMEGRSTRYRMRQRI